MEKKQTYALSRITNLIREFKELEQADHQLAVELLALLFDSFVPDSD